MDMEGDDPHRRTVEAMLAVSVAALDADARRVPGIRGILRAASAGGTAGGVFCNPSP
jgi:hypothetical protein